MLVRGVSAFGTCPDYEVLFSNHGLYYVGRAYTSKRGTYEATDTRALRRAIAVLQQLEFFKLSVQPSLIMDAPHFIVAAQRCGVSTKLDWPFFGSRPDIEALFDKLDGITNSLTWRKSSTSVESPLNLLAPIP